MENFKKLMARYMGSGLTRKELDQLKESSDSLSDESLGAELEDIWNGYDRSSLDRFGGIRLALPEVGGGSNTRRLLRLYRSAAAILIPLLAVATFMAVRYGGKYLAPEQTVAVATASGERSTVMLPDGSKVYLNNGSTLEYGSHFGRKDRPVKLSGEAYFEVSKDEERRFTVQTPGLKVVVTGTSFNISAYEYSDCTEVSLLEGQVKVASEIDPDRTITLKPNQKVVMNNTTGLLALYDSDMVYETAWMQDELIFRSMSFADVVRRLEMYYGQTVEVSGNVSDKKFTGRFMEERITDVLKMLQEHYNFTYKVRNGDIFIDFGE